MPQVDLGGVQVPTPPSEWQDAWEDEAEAGKARVLAHPETPLTATQFASVHGIQIDQGPGTVGIDRRWAAALINEKGHLFTGQFEWPHQTIPTLPDILTALASEAAHVETVLDELEWARASGVIAEGTQKYLTALRQAQHLRTWLPVGAYETLLWEVTQL
jgi:hypothetical protein